jgi:hypothetical protein
VGNHDVRANTLIEFAPRDVNRAPQPRIRGISRVYGDASPFAFDTRT